MVDLDKIEETLNACKHCDGTGVVENGIEPECCGRPRSTGECCGNPEPAQSFAACPICSPYRELIAELRERRPSEAEVIF